MQPIIAVIMGTVIAMSVLYHSPKHNNESVQEQKHILIPVKTVKETKTDSEIHVPISIWMEEMQ